ncbi:MAG: integration host factor subunit beta [Verrucomicrobiae bacterium]|nr:integration host factor subunit beta [Verrucomicrobiae bacterium]
MTKRDLVVKIASDTGLIQQDVLNVIQKTLDHIAGALATGENVELRNFGVFEVKQSKARIGRNPNAPEIDVRIPPRAVVKFKPGKEMRQKVVRLSKEGGDGAKSAKREHRNSATNPPPSTQASASIQQHA